MTSHDNKKRQTLLRSLKQIISLEKSLAWEKSCVHYSSIDAPSSSKPQKKYSDISGLPAKYRDPATNLRYAFCEEYSILQTLPSDIVAGYMALRKSNATVG